MYQVEISNAQKTVQNLSQTRWKPFMKLFFSLTKTILPRKDITLQSDQLFKSTMLLLWPFVYYQACDSSVAYIDSVA